jgi:hypothetical protein
MCKKDGSGTSRPKGILDRKYQSPGQESRTTAYKPEGKAEGEADGQAREIGDDSRKGHKGRKNRNSAHKGQENAKKGGKNRSVSGKFDANPLSGGKIGPARLYGGKGDIDDGRPFGSRAAARAT